MNPITLPQLTRVKAVPAKTDIVVLAVTGTEHAADDTITVHAPGTLAKGYEKKFGVPLAQMAADLGAKAKPGTIALLPAPGGQRFLLVGMGAEAPTPASVRAAAGTAARQVAGLSGVRQVAVALPADEPELLRAVVEGTLLGQYTYAPLTAEPEKKPTIEFSVVSSVADPAVVEEARVVVEAQLVAAEWVNVPANLLYPETFAKAAKDLASGRKIAVDILTEKELARDGFGGHLAVGGGSARQPRLTRLTYAPARAKAHLVLVGKGVTFDTGGLNLKPAEYMYHMRSDMGGAAAIIAATCAIAQLGLKVKVTAYACMAENMPSDRAFRPSDVLTIYGGTTVENFNSDAEGRLVLADGLARGAEDKPDLIVDVATLTGAAMIALGTQTTGIFSDSDAVAERVLGAADTAGELSWRLPLGEWCNEGLESKVADLKSGGGRWGGASIAAAFLRRFVPDEIDWAHIDIAPTGFNEGSPRGEIPAGGTGAGVRTLVEIARGMQA